MSELALPESASDRECPWSGVAVPVQHAGKVGWVMERALCTSRCALYDRVNKRPGCVVDMRGQIEALTVAVKEGLKSVGAK